MYSIKDSFMSSKEMTKELFTMFYAKFHWLINMSYI